MAIKTHRRETTVEAELTEVQRLISFLEYVAEDELTDTEQHDLIVTASNLQITLKAVLGRLEI